MLITTLNDIKKDIEELRGATVRVFGQPTTLPSGYDDTDCTIDTLDIIDAFMPYEFNINDFTEWDDDNEEYYNPFDSCESIDDVVNTLEDLGYINISEGKGDNSYNWGAPISNDFDIMVYKDLSSNGEFMVFKVHRYGDVRCNYTDECILHFSNEYEFYEALSECSKYQSVEIDGVRYDFTIDVLSDGYEVYNEDGYYIGTAFGYDVDEVKEEIVELLKK